MDVLAQVTIFLLHSHELIRVALAELLVTAGAIVVGEAPSGEVKGLGQVARLRPDVVLVELAFGGESGVGTIRELSSLAPDSRILALGDSEGPSGAVEAIIAGACGYVVKSAAPDEIVGAVRQSAAGGCVISPQIADELLDRRRRREIPVTAQSEQAAAGIRAVLSERELEIFERLAGGGSNREIGLELSLSEHTVKNHVAKILNKLGLENRIQAAVRAVRSGIS
jgi:DNA-binding NarL/FixJ family response regulator